MEGPAGRPRLLVVGDLVEDVVVWLSGPVRPGTDTPSRTTRSRGGSAANVAVAAAPYVSTRLVCAVGDDLTGRGLVDQVGTAGVEVVACRVGRTGTIVVLVAPDGERSFLTDRGAAAELDVLPEGALTAVDHVHVPLYGLDLDRTGTTLRTLLQDPPPSLSLDASSAAVLERLDDLAGLLAQSRPALMFANADEARLLPSLPGTDLVVKDGPRATTVHGADGGVRTYRPPRVDEVRDTTGAGDAFAAGWLSARMTGLGEERCADRAHALAAAVLQHPGAGPGGRHAADR